MIVVHRVGELKVGDRIVLCLTSAEHRGDAFAGCEYIMDWLKTEAPFWKKEQTPDGERWVDARESDDKARAVARVDRKRALRQLESETIR